MSGSNFISKDVSGAEKVAHFAWHNGGVEARNAARHLIHMYTEDLKADCSKQGCLSKQMLTSHFCRAHMKKTPSSERDKEEELRPTQMQSMMAGDPRVEVLKIIEPCLTDVLNM